MEMSGQLHAPDQYQCGRLFQAVVNTFTLLAVNIRTNLHTAQCNAALWRFEKHLPRPILAAQGLTDYCRHVLLSVACSYD